MRNTVYTGASPPGRGSFFLGKFVPPGGKSTISGGIFFFLQIAWRTHVRELILAVLVLDHTALERLPVLGFRILVFSLFIYLLML